MKPTPSESAPMTANIRRLWSPDLDAILDHFLRLDPESRRLRFGGPVTDEFIETYARRVLQIDALVYGAYIDGVLRAVAELRGVLPGMQMTAEAAFSVESRWQDAGIGDALVTRIVAAAQNRGVRSLHMICLRENRRMQHLVRKHRAVLGYHAGEAEATLSPPWPTPFSIGEEIAGETQGFVHAVIHWPG